MSHLFETGFSVREVPWHGLGNILDEYPGSWAEARTLAGLDWDPIEVPAYEVGTLYADGRADVTLIDDFKQIKHSGTGDRLGIVGDGYHLITHDVMGEIYEAILEKSDGEVLYETAGALDKGKRVWVLARLGGQIELPGDPSPLQPYMALMTSHDGSGALKVCATNVRIVCANTWHAADMDASRRGSTYSFKHTKNWRKRVDEARDALTATHENIAHTVAEAKRLLRIKVNAKQTRTFIEEFAMARVIKNTVAKQPLSKRDLAARMDQPRVQTSLRYTIDQMTQILDSRTCDGIRGNMWGLVQAAGEFTDHFRETVSDESYFSRTVLADREPLKLTALRIAREVSKA
jgi:phage/plasmid-like protein (TIGR03299 family)